MSMIDQLIKGNLRSHTPEEILAHPRFTEARWAYVHAILRLYEHDAFMNRLLIEAARSVVFFHLVCLHFAHDERDRATWPTMGLLQETLSPYGIASARRIEDIVARFVATGYVESGAAPKDRRARILKPSAKALAHDLDWLAAQYMPLDAMFPDPGYGPPVRRDPAFQRVQRPIGRRMFAYAAQLMSDNPAVMLFMGRDAGMMILIKLIQMAGHEGDSATRRPSFANIGSRFGISRTHVRNTLQDAAQRGLMQMSGTAITLSPALVAAFDRFVADTMAGQDLMFGMAMRERDASTA